MMATMKEEKMVAMMASLKVVTTAKRKVEMKVATKAS